MGVQSSEGLAGRAMVLLEHTKFSQRVLDWPDSQPSESSPGLTALVKPWQTAQSICRGLAKCATLVFTFQ